MKTIKVLITIFALSNILPAVEENASSVTIHVSSKANTDYGKNESKSQERNLEISLTNTGKEAISNFSIRWTMFGHNVKDRSLVKLESGEIKGSLKQGSTEIMKSKAVKLQSQRETSVSKRGRGRRTSTQKIPASGSTYYGYSVKVYDGDKLIASAFSQPSIKELEAH